MKKLTFLFITLTLLVATSGCTQNNQTQPTEQSADETQQPLLGDIHIHADFKVYLNNTPVNFTQEKYMSSKDKSWSNFMHLHDMDGDVVHQHMSTLTLGDFFRTIKMDFTQNCFDLDNGEKYCNEGDKTLKMYVNGKPNTDLGKYQLHDLDRVLITYGNDDQATIEKQIASVTDKACIQSERCPERGKPHDESTCLSSSDCIFNPNDNHTTTEEDHHSEE